MLWYRLGKFAHFDPVGKRIYLYDEQGVISFGRKLKEIRLKKGFTQERLANEAGLPPSQISRIETGVINTSLSHICLIAHILKVKPRDLMDFELS